MTEDTHPAADRPLTVREGTELRSQCVTDEGEAISWQAAADRFELFLTHAGNSGALVSDWDVESKLPYHRGHDQLLLEQIRDLRAGLRASERLVYTHSVTLSGTPYMDNQWYPCLDYLNDLQKGWESARKSLYSTLEGVGKWEYALLTDADPNGFPILRLVLFTTDNVESEILYDNVVSTHVANSPVATDEIHIQDRIVRQGRSLGIDEFIEENLSCFLDNRNDTWQCRGFDALLWSSNTGRVSFSQGATEFIETVETDANADLTTTE